MKLGISSPAFSNDDFEMRLESVAEHFSLWEIVADLKDTGLNVEYLLQSLLARYTQMI